MTRRSGSLIVITARRGPQPHRCPSVDHPALNPGAPFPSPLLMPIPAHRRRATSTMLTPKFDSASYFDLKKARRVEQSECGSDKGEWSQTLGLEGIGTIHVPYRRRSADLVGSDSCRMNCGGCRSSWPGWTCCWTIRGSSPRSCRSSTRDQGRPSTPMETYLRLMFLKFRYRLGFESLCREVSDSITWRQFCRIGSARAGAAPDHVDEADHPVRVGGGRRVERGAVGEGGGGEAAALHPGPGRHHRGPGERRLPDRLRPAGQSGPADRYDRAADPGRRRRDPHQDAGPVPGRRETGTRPERETADPQRRRERRGDGGGAPQERRAGRPGRHRRRRSGTASDQRETGTAAGPHQGRRPESGRRTRPRRRTSAGPARPRRQRSHRAARTRPARSPRRPGNASPGPPRTARPAGSACTTPTPARSRRAGSGSRSSSAPKPRSATTTTASSSTTTCNPATPPTPPG